MADNTSSGGGTGSVAMVAIVVLVLAAIVAGYFLISRGGISPGHAFSGSIQMPAGPITGHGSVH